MNLLIGAIHRIETLNTWIGRILAACVVAVVVIAFTVVVLRYGFSTGRIWIQELALWLHAVVFMLGAGYALRQDGHVRVDVFYRPASERFKAWVNLLGCLCLLWPFLFAVWTYAFPYVAVSWTRLESSQASGGLPGLFLLKTAILGFCVVLALQSLALITRSALVLTGRRKTVFDRSEEADLRHGG